MLTLPTAVFSQPHWAQKYGMRCGKSTMSLFIWSNDSQNKKIDDDK
jgi:hypothetical protein